MARRWGYTSAVRSMKLKGEMGAWLAGVWGKSWSKMLTLVSVMNGSCFG
jgi:hypothetical protein